MIILCFSKNVLSNNEPELKSHFGIGLELSSWKPSTLDLKPTSLIKGIPGTSLNYGIVVVIRWFGDSALRTSFLEWTQSDLQDRTDVEMVRLRPLCLDLKNNIIRNTDLSPYVSYGVLFIWAAEKAIGVKNFPEGKSQFGYGASVGAGLDFKLSKHWTSGIEYQYWYAKLPNSIGLTDDYSGPKISLKVIFFF